MTFWKKAKLEKQLMQEIKQYAGVQEFPWQDARAFSDLIAAYNGKGGNFAIGCKLMAYVDTLYKYPTLQKNWDELMVKYKKFGLFECWTPIE